MIENFIFKPFTICFTLFQMRSTPSTLYHQSADKQRIVAVGKNNFRIVEFVLFVLNQYGRKVDHSTPVSEKISDAAVIITAASELLGLLDYHHHILILSQLLPENKSDYLLLANATPKGGTIIYDETDPVAASIAKADRADVTSNPFGIAKHEMQNNRIVLISSTNEKFQTHLSSADDLKNVSAAKELLKKIGISSGQFYRAIVSFQ